MQSLTIHIFANSLSLRMRQRDRSAMIKNGKKSHLLTLKSQQVHLQVKHPRERGEVSINQHT
jgi:hypothetical protein